jgi:hypothetical protein
LMYPRLYHGQERGLNGSLESQLYSVGDVVRGRVRGAGRKFLEDQKRVDEKIRLWLVKILICPDLVVRATHLSI